MDYPENIIKGIPNNSFFKDGEIGTHLFYFELHRDVQLTRDDGMIEQSINWVDDDSVIELTLNQRRTSDNDLQFKAGVAILSRSKIDELKKFQRVEGLLAYERSPLDGNPYHGNLLLPEEVPKAKMIQIAGSLALAVLSIITQEHET